MIRSRCLRAGRRTGRLPATPRPARGVRRTLASAKSRRTINTFSGCNGAMSAEVAAHQPLAREHGQRIPGFARAVAVEIPGPQVGEYLLRRHDHHAHVVEPGRSRAGTTSGEAGNDATKTSRRSPASTAVSRRVRANAGPGWSPSRTPVRQRFSERVMAFPWRFSTSAVRHGNGNRAQPDRSPRKPSRPGRGRRRVRGRSACRGRWPSRPRARVPPLRPRLAKRPSSCAMMSGAPSHSGT